jgi:thermitase
VQSDHPDLVGNLVPGHNFIQENDDTTDDVGHGTHVTGIIGATRLNSVGIAGIVPGASIMPLKVCARDGCQTSNIIHAVEYAAHHGVSVVNMSLGGPNYSQVMRDALEEAAAAGMIAVSSTGNDGCNMDMDSECRAYPAMYQLDNQISVASIRPDGLLSQFSNYGFHRADIAAPGENILSTTVGSNYIVLSGTSMATPMVTGAVALLRSIFPKESHQNIIARITQCGHPLPTGSALNVRSGNALDIEAAIAGGACLSAAGK